jgi:glutamate synthase (NADPH/NADH) large chain/glutamate synthase (ferredoxin)
MRVVPKAQQPLAFLRAEGLYDPAFEHDSCGVGFVANLNRTRSHGVISKALTVLDNLVHRGAIGGDKATGDGAGLLFQIPHEFFLKHSGISLPGPGEYGVGMIFMPRDPGLREAAREVMQEKAQERALRILGWRTVPVERSCLGDIARATEPAVEQVFLVQPGADADALERSLYVYRRICEKAVWESLRADHDTFYVCSLSARTLVYKGLLIGAHLADYYPDLKDESLASTLCVLHQRFSTNTFPTWPLAQPYRFAAHNGEINTLRGNVARMKSREATMSSDSFGDDLQKLFPIIIPGMSDSSQLDNVLELLTLGGRSLPHAMMMMIPEPFGTQYHMSSDKRAFYEFYSTFMEPWDGPAAVVCSDGRLVGGILDRNGLRPCRYTVVSDGHVILASEVGTLDLPADQIVKQGRLKPATMLLVDTEEGRIVGENEVKSRIIRQRPYRRWLEENRLELRGLFEVRERVKPEPETLLMRQKAFGYTQEDLEFIIRPMALHGQEPVGSMGTDTPLAVLSDKPKLLFDYFKQLFAQVTNPPIDPLRETLVMSLTSYIGREANFLEDVPEHCRQLKLPHPVLSNEDIQTLKSSSNIALPSEVIDTVFPVADEAAGLLRAMERIFEQAEAAIGRGAKLIILSDREVSRERAAVPILLAVSGLHHYLVRAGYRTRVGLVVESGEVREVMHFALLIGFGASAVNPYLVFETMTDMHHRLGTLPLEMDCERLVDNYYSAVKKGLLKTLSRMGISTLRSYRGAQIFGAVGLSQEFVDEYFTGTSSQVGGIGLAEVASETALRHAAAFEDDRSAQLLRGGEYQYLLSEQRHTWNHQTVADLQHACINRDPKAYERFSEAVARRSEQPIVLRDLFEFNPWGPIPVSEVEPAGSIVKRFVTGAMSLGSLGKEAHETLAIAMNRLGAASNTGEGGEDPARFEPMPNGDSRCSKIKQVASGRFGVNAHYLVNAEEIQIKMAQGAKPGEGGQLPGHKVDEIIARTRYSTPGVTLISPPPHHDIYSIEDLAQLIFDLRNVNPRAGISVKLVSEPGVGTIAAGVAKAKADMVLISGHDGGTGASPLTSIKHTGLPWELGVAEAHQTLTKNRLRAAIRVQVDGQLLTGRDVVIGALLGAEEFGFATAPLVAVGCCLLRKCHLNSCAMGVATQDPRLRARFRGKPESVMTYFTFLAEEVRQIMASLGVRRFDELIGRSDLLRKRTDIPHWKASCLDFSAVFWREETEGNDPEAVRCKGGIQNPLGEVLDHELISLAKPALEDGERVVIDRTICNRDRATGSMLSGEIARRYGNKGLPPGTIECRFTGSAGQSFGAFLANGVDLRLEGNANDYLGKGMSGGRVVVVPPAESNLGDQPNVIVGNTVLYGATGGEVFIRGAAGERFCVRNSGATVVIGAVGDHGCEYMTGGTVVILGSTGVNFAAGMSGGIAYVLDENLLFDTLCNLDMVDLYPVSNEADAMLLRSLLEKHADLTKSPRSMLILEQWPEYLPRFIKVLPIEYEKVLQRSMEKEDRHSESPSATEEVYADEGT